jgi:hypothetical protein
LLNRRRGGAQGTGELGAAVDAELEVGVAEVRFDGLGGEKQALGDLAVGEAVGGEFGHAPLARGQRFRTGEPLATRARARRPQPCRRSTAPLACGSAGSQKRQPTRS